MKVLLELRPALEGHSGIPQETRLLFRGLAASPDVDAIGLLQSGGLVAEPGLPVERGAVRQDIDDHTKTDMLSKVVVSLQQAPPSHKLESARKRMLGWFGPPWAVVRSVLGRRVQLGIFEPLQYRDFLWRSLFAKSLQESDIALVTQRGFRVLRWPWSRLHAIGVVSSWFGRATYLRLDTTDIDVVIAETPFPARVLAPTRLIVRYHDAIPLLMPHTVKDRGYHRSAHFQALRRNAMDGAWFACVSEATRRDLISVMPSLAGRTVTIPNMLSHHFFHESADDRRVPEVIWSRKSRNAPHKGGASIDPDGLVDGSLSYLLIVGTIEPRKNHLALIDAWEHLRADGFHRLNLVIVGSLGWDHHAILERLSPWLERGGVHLLTAVPADDLRLLYRHAAVTVCPSFGEGFDFPGVEAMRSGGVVAASDLPVHRDVFADACQYFSPYSVSELVAAIRMLLGPDATARRAALVQAGAEVSSRYLPERVMPFWEDFLHSVVQ